MNALLLALALSPAADAAPTAAGVVRSREWVVRRGEKREEEFVGDVRYESAGIKLTADWALYQHASKSWKARGSIVVVRRLEDGTVLEARGETASFAEDGRGGVLLPAPGGRVRFKRQPPDGSEPDLGEGDRLDWTDTDKAVLSGNARVSGPRADGWADTATWERATGAITLGGGRPVLRKKEGEWTLAIKAEQVSATEAPRRVASQGKVRGWLQFHDAEKLKRLAR
ncbi:MAG: hypothetical protein SF051_03580 [Elusimicrobiota bacterium]|nr:hypothetical protein [Elusimicrobiota bacterium]